MNIYFSHKEFISKSANSSKKLEPNTEHNSLLPEKIFE